MIKQSDFKPAWWLSNRHLQTMWGSLTRKQPNLPLEREHFDLPDNDFIDIDWIKPKKISEDTPIIVVLHGLGGSIESHYAIHIMANIHKQNWLGVFMHYRGCSGQPNRKPFGYHSGYTEDLAYLISVLKQRYPKQPIATIGYSLGGNVLLKWLGETGKKNPLDTAVAISVPFDLALGADKMLQGISRLYQWYLLRSLRKYINYKFQVIESPIDLEPLASIKTFWEFDHHITAPLHGFKSAMDYYKRASSRQYLKAVTVPTLILHAKDDPLMTEDVIPTKEELSETITIELSDKGGHVGFISGDIPFQANYWLEQRITAHLLEYFAS